MEKLYAQNPGPIRKRINNPAELIVLGNPAPKKKTNIKKNPNRVAAGRKAWKTQQQKKQKKVNRMNPEKTIKTGRKLLGKSSLVAVGTFGAVRGTAFLMQKFGQNLPAVVKDYAPIIVPIVTGTIIATKAKNTNEVMQGLAGGMVFGGVSQGLNKVLPPAVTSGSGLSGAMGYEQNSLLAGYPEGSMVVTPDGAVLDANGSMYGKAEIASSVPQSLLAESQEEYSFNSYSEESEVY